MKMFIRPKHSLLLTVTIVMLMMVVPFSAMSQTTITWLADASGGPDRLNVYEQVVSAFNESQSEIFVELEPVVNFSEYYETVWLRMAADVAPDLVFNNNPTNIHQGMFLDLTPYIESDGSFSLADYEPTSLGFGYASNQEGIFTLPNHLATQGYYYNPRHFLEAGLLTPHEMVMQDRWSWDDFIDAGKRIVRYSADGTLQQGYASSAMFEALVNTHGTRTVDVIDGQQVSLAQTREVIQAMELWQSLFQEHALFGGGTNEFSSGQIAMLTGWNDSWSVISTVDFEVESVRYPWTDTKSIMVAGGSWGIPLNSRQPEAAWEFLKFVVGDNSQALFGRTAGAIPSKVEVAIDVWLDESWGPRYKEFAFLNPILEHGLLSERMFAPSWSDISRVLNPVVGQLQRGEISPAGAAEQLDQAIRSVINTD